MPELEFGIFDGFSESEMEGLPADVYEAHIRDARATEAMGYRYYFFIEHPNAPFAYISAPNVYLAALARETTILRFGPMVYQLPMHHPIRLAQDAAMVDQLSRGRLEFGIGYGIHAHEFMRWKLPFSKRRDMGIEAMEIVVKAWTEESVTYEGAYWSVDEALPKPKPYQQPHPPVWVGAHSATSFDYAARYNYSVAPKHRRRYSYGGKIWLLPKGMAGLRPPRTNAPDDGCTACPRGGKRRAGASRGGAVPTARVLWTTRHGDYQANTSWLWRRSPLDRR